ncbi:rod shape-determining protein [Streptomyces sp. YIM S03343]
MTAVRHPAPPLHRHRPWPSCRRCYGIALDLGSARTRAVVPGRGLILDAPTATARRPDGTHPGRRGTVIDAPACASMLDHLLDENQLPRSLRPLVMITTPVLDGPAHRTAARAAVDVLHPRSVSTVPTARAVAEAAGTDLSRPLLVVDLGAQFIETVLLTDGAVSDARSTALATGDLETADAGDAVVSMLTAMLHQDRTSVTLDALRRGILLSGGGALRPGISDHLTARLDTPIHLTPAPQTAAVRGAAELLDSTHTHPPTPPPPRRPPGRMR